MFTYNPRTRMGVGGRGWGMRRGIDGWSALNESWRENAKVGERMTKVGERMAKVGERMSATDTL